MTVIGAPVQSLDLGEHDPGHGGQASSDPVVAQQFNDGNGACGNPQSPQQKVLK